MLDKFQDRTQIARIFWLRPGLKRFDRILVPMEEVARILGHVDKGQPQRN